MSAHLENALQTTCATFLARALPPGSTWTSVDLATGQRMDAIAGARRKMRGLRPGWPDMQVIYQGRFVGLELKAPGGVVSDSQRRMAAEIIQAGGHWFVCRSVEDVERALHDAGVPLRATSFPAAEYDARREARMAAPKKAPRARKEPAEAKNLRPMARARAAGIYA